MGEHPHPWTHTVTRVIEHMLISLALLLHAQDRKSRHRCSKPRRRSARDFCKNLMSSQARQLCYPRSNFLVISSPHQGGHRGSLSQYFYPGFNLSINPVRLTFAFALYSGCSALRPAHLCYRKMFLTQMSQPLGPVDIKLDIRKIVLIFDIFSTGCHPSQTVHLSMSLFRDKQCKS